MGSREALRREAQRIYKENVKKIPKRNRIPFAEFFKQFKKMKTQQHAAPVAAPTPETEDFDFNEMVNLNDSIEVEEETPAEDKKQE